MDDPESAFICKICYSSYDEDLKKPIIISPCSHTICLECLKEILSLTPTCPFCKKEIKASVTEMKPNYELIDIIYKLKNTSNVARCVKCKNLINTIYFSEKNSNVQFICKHCAKNGEFADENIMSLEELIKIAEKDLQNYQTELNYNINKENLKNLATNRMTEDLKKTICELIDQKKDLLASFLEMPDFTNMIEKYRKSLDNILKSKDTSIKYLQENSTILKSTNKDFMINNILNIKNIENDDILVQKVKNFSQNFQKELNKNKLYMQSILQTITNDIIYQSNIALFNSIRECLRDDFSLLEKLTNVGIDSSNMPYNISNFQQNHIQMGTLYAQMQLKNQLKNIDLEQDYLEIMGSNSSHSVISEAYVASIIGLIIEYHPSMSKLKGVLERQFNCRASLIEKDETYYGVQLYFQSSKTLETFMEKKAHSLKVDEMIVKLYKKKNKVGNRFYVKYT